MKAKSGLVVRLRILLSVTENQLPIAPHPQVICIPIPLVFVAHPPQPLPSPIEAVRAAFRVRVFSRSVSTSILFRKPSQHSAWVPLDPPSLRRAYARISTARIHRPRLQPMRCSRRPSGRTPSSATSTTNTTVTRWLRTTTLRKT